VVEKQLDTRREIMREAAEKTGYHLVETRGNVAFLVVPSKLKQSGEPKEDAAPREYCAVCLPADMSRAGVFIVGSCSNCGASKGGHGPLVVDFDAIVEAERVAEETGLPSPLDLEHAKNNPCTDEVVGGDGLPRKVHIRDVILPELGVFHKDHYASLVYREIKEDEDKPEGFDPDAKYKQLTVVCFKADESPVTLKEIEQAIGSEYITVVAGEE